MSSDTPGGDSQDEPVRPGGEVAAGEAAALLLALARIVEDQVAASEDIHPDLHSSLVHGLRRTATELATAHGLDELLGDQQPPVDGIAWANQLVALLRESPRDRRDATDRGGDFIVADAAGPTPSPASTSTSTASAPDQVTEWLDRSGQESFPASDPPSP